MKNLPISAQRRAARAQAQSDAAAAIDRASGLRESTEATMVAAHRAGMAYWRANRPVDTARADLESLARSCGWHGEDNAAWLAGFYGARQRDVDNVADTIAANRINPAN